MRTTAIAALAAITIAIAACTPGNGGVPSPSGELTSPSLDSLPTENASPSASDSASPSAS